MRRLPRTRFECIALLSIVLCTTSPLWAQVNVARLGTAEQSTTGFGGDAARAIDGSSDGNYGNGSVTHTETGDPAPWWQVDLGATYTLSGIVVWNRTDCCSERLTNFRVSALDEDGGEEWSEDVFTDGLDFPNPSLELVPPEGTTGRTIRVDMLDDNALGDIFLSLAEVQVNTTDDVELPPAIVVAPVGGRVAVGESFTFEVVAEGSAPLEYRWIHDEATIEGATESTYTIESATPDDAGLYAVEVSNPEGEVTSDPVSLAVLEFPNIAVFGVASQSSTDFGGAPSRAIDGNTDGVYNNGSVTHTANDPTAWWEVELPGPSEIASIVLWNRVDCCQGRLTNFRVTVLDAARDELWSEDFFTDGSAPDTSVEGYEIEVGEDDARFVRLQFIDDPFRAEAWLSLAEVEVLGSTVIVDPSECPDEGDAEFADTHCEGLAIDGPEDDGPGIYTVTADANDATGDLVQYLFVADNGLDEPIIIGPQSSNTANLRLRIGTWSVAVHADDNELCEDVAPDASCIDEIEVVPSDPDLVSVLGVASQSSTGFGGTAGLAIDDDTSGVFGDGSVTHTAPDDPAPWWEVDLLQPYVLDRVVLWNRTDCCSARLSNFKVTVFGANGAIEYDEDFHTDGTFPETTQEGLEIVLDGDVTGQIVRVELNDVDIRDPAQLFLSLAEVEIYRTSGGEPGPRFVRGDVDDSGAINITDGIATLNFLFLGGRAPVCLDAADADDSGQVNITDGIYVLNFLFLGGPPPAEPHPECGADQEGDALGCAASHGACQ